MSDIEKEALEAATHRRIFLQPGQYPEVSWCSEQIDDDDVPYLLEEDCRRRELWELEVTAFGMKITWPCGREETVLEWLGQLPSGKYVISLPIEP